MAPRGHRSRQAVSNATKSDNPFLIMGSILLMDTEREKQIGLGPNYPFEKLAAGECIISTIMGDEFGIEAGDHIKISMQYSYILETIAW